MNTKRSKSHDARSASEVVTEPFNNIDTYYALTIKQTGSMNYCTKDDLDELLLCHLMTDKRYPIVLHTKVFELDKANRLHLHALISSMPKLWLKPRRGWHIFISPIATQTDKFRWEQYMKKTAYNNYEQEEILLLNDTRNLCLFE